MSINGTRALAIAAMLTLAVPPTVAVAADGPRKPGQPQGSGLTIPRFVTLRASEVNLRAGPNVNYPIVWVFQRKEMPVEIIAEYDTWRRIRDWQGAEGWVHQSMLAGRRGVVVTGAARTLRRDPDAAAQPVAQAKPGVMGALLKCVGLWCQLDLKGWRGWMKRDEFWGVYPNETVE